jgi:hypothetical protein
MFTLRPVASSVMGVFYGTAISAFIEVDNLHPDPATAI